MFECLVGDLAMSAGFLPQPSDCFTESQTQYTLIRHGTWHSMHGHPTAILPTRILRLRCPIKPGVFSWKLPPWKVTVPDPNAQELDLLSLGGGGRWISGASRPGDFWNKNSPRSSGFCGGFCGGVFLVAKCKGKIRQKNPPENPPAGIEKSAGGEPPLRPPHRAPPPPITPPPPLGRATPSPEPSGLGLAAPVCLCRWLVRSTSACGGSHLVAQPVSGGLHSFLGAGAQRGANAALAGPGHGFSEMHALSIFGVQVWALNI